MAKRAFKFYITGMDEVGRKLRLRFKDALQEIDMEMGDQVEQMALRAKKSLPSQFNELRSAIYVKKHGFLKYSINGGKNYAAYVEFGTGRYAANYVNTIEPEWQEIAHHYIVNKRGRLPAHPYLYPAIKYGLKLMTKRIQNIIDKKL